MLIFSIFNIRGIPFQCNSYRLLSLKYSNFSKKKFFSMSNYQFRVLSFFSRQTYALPCYYIYYHSNKKTTVLLSLLLHYYSYITLCVTPHIYLYILLYFIFLYVPLQKYCIHTLLHICVEQEYNHISKVIMLRIMIITMTQMTKT